VEEIIALAADNLPHRIAMINHMIKHGKQVTEMKADDDGRIRVFFKKSEPTAEPPLPNLLRNYLGDGEDDGPPPAEPSLSEQQAPTGLPEDSPV
jgi:hypothetical protein